MGYPTIPRKIHFIWVGGGMPAKNQECLKTFKEKALGYELNLWIDVDNLLAGTRRGAIVDMFKTTGADGMTKLAGDYRQGPLLGRGDDATIRDQVGGSSDFLSKARTANRASLEDFAHTHGFKLRYASEFGNEGTTAVAKMMAQYNREMTERATNFGAASDILRILILVKYGGIYFDTDVVCTERLPYITCPQNGALWSLVAQPGMTISKRDWFDVDWWIRHYGQGEYPKVCNSTIACHAGSNSLDAYRQVVQRNYDGVFDDDAAMDRYYNMANIRSETIRITGPTAALEASGLLQNRAEVDQGANQSVSPRGRFQTRKAYNRRLTSQLANHKGTEWFKLKDAFFFPAYLIEDKFFHQWL